MMTLGDIFDGLCTYRDSNDDELGLGEGVEVFVQMQNLTETGNGMRLTTPTPSHPLAKQCNFDKYPLISYVISC